MLEDDDPATDWHPKIFRVTVDGQELRAALGLACMSYAPPSRPMCPEDLAAHRKLWEHAEDNLGSFVRGFKPEQNRPFRKFSRYDR